jgi:hypothetical protein
MKAAKLTVVLTLAAVLTACPGDDAAPPADAPPVETPGAAPPGPAMTPTAPGQIPLRPMAGSGVSGEASITDEAGGARVQLAIRGAEPNVRYQANIVTGTCDDPGGGVADLDLFFVDQAGSGTSQAVVPIAPGTLEATPHSLVVQHPQREANPIVACGEIGGF